MGLTEKKGNSRLSKAEKEKLVIKLLKENKTYRETTHLAGVSPNFISNTIKKSQGVESQAPVNIQAIKMFEEGKRLVDVTIALRIDPKETLQYYGQYQLLIGLEELPKIMDRLRDDLVPFVDLFKEMRSKFSLDHIKKASKIASEMDEAIACLAIVQAEKNEAIASLAIVQAEKVRELEVVEKLYQLHKGFQSLNTPGNLPS